MRKLKLTSNVIAVLHDCVMAAASFALALYLRLGDRTLDHASSYLREGTVGFTLLLLLTMLYYRTYRRIWAYTSLNDLLSVARAGTIALLLFYGAMFFATRLEMLPRSVPFIHWMTLMLCLTFGRVVTRITRDKAALNRLLGRSHARIPVLLIGVNEQTENFIRASERSVDFPYRAVGIVGENARQSGREIHGVRVYGTLDELPYIIRKLARKSRSPQRLLLTDAALPRETLEKLLAIAEEQGMSLARLPSLGELKAGQQVGDIHAVAVEDILGRTQAVLDRDAMQQFVQGKRVLITGAGGSIGSELTRQIARFAPAELALYELSEFALYEIDRELNGDELKHIPRRAVLGDVRDAAQLARVFAAFKPEIVFHAAAIKHVPLAEANPEQAVLTNILGSAQVADACVAHGVAAMVQVSTDKAVNPSSVMGATKRVAELYCQALAEQNTATRFITVRFGNVLNSAGSVVPLFQQQIAAGGPVTVTHRDMVRYFMTISEAVQLILQAAVIGVEGNEAASIFVLDMGDPVRIEEMACQMIRLAGFTPYKDIAIEFTGLRPGEKLFEELFYEAENLIGTRHQSIRRARPQALERTALMSSIALVVDAARAGKTVAIPLFIKQVIAEYQLSEPNKATL